MSKEKRPSIPAFKTYKNAAIPNIPTHEKNARYVEPEWAKSNPSWRIQQLEFCEPFGFHRLSPDKLPEVMQKLANFESMTWSEILIQAKKQNHSIEIWKLEKPAQKRLKELGLFDTPGDDSIKLEELVSLHLCGEERIWGFLQGKVLHLLWWDPEHKVYECKLKHT